MNTIAMESRLGPIEVQLLSEEDLVAISGGVSPIAAGCLLAVGGAAVVVVGLCVGIAAYLYLN